MPKGILFFSMLLLSRNGNSRKCSTKNQHTIVALSSKINRAIVEALFILPCLHEF